MNCFKVSSFFGCISLRIGGFIIACLALAFEILSFTAFNFGWNWNVIPHLLFTIILLFGIYSKREGYILSAIVWDVVILITNILCVFVLFPVVWIYWSDVGYYIEIYLHVLFNIESKNTHDWYIIIWSIYTVIAFIRMYFIIILCNLRKSFILNNRVELLNNGY